MAGANRSTWPALLVAPTIVLANLTIAYSRVTPECTRQSSALLHALSALALVVALAATLHAWRVWRHMRPAGGSRSEAVLGETPRHEERPPFLALTATLVGALSCGVVVAMWLPVLLLSPCG